MVLHTPYGIAPTDFIAVSCNHKLTDSGKIVPGRVGHDRIQGGDGGHSIGEAIREWFGLPVKGDFERIDVDAAIHKDGHFILRPIAAQLRTRKKPIPIAHSKAPLSYNDQERSPLWENEIRAVNTKHPAEAAWIAEQLGIVVRDHLDEKTANVHEADLLRVAGALSKLGLQLGPYAVKGYDCVASRFRFGSLPSYWCAVEIKKDSTDFQYQMKKYSPLPRAVVLCVTHTLQHVPDDIDVVELRALHSRLEEGR